MYPSMYPVFDSHARRSAPSTTPRTGASNRSRSWADSISTTSGFEFSVHTGLEPPKCHLETYSIHLRNHPTGRFIGVIPSSVVRLNARRFGLVALPIELSAADLSLAVITVKDRTLTPVVKLFLECAREAAKSIE